MNERQAAMQRAYAEANRRLREFHLEEFHVLLAEVYEERDMDVRKRLTGAMKRADQIAKAKALIERLESDDK